MVTQKGRAVLRDSLGRPAKSELGTGRLSFVVDRPERFTARPDGQVAWAIRSKFNSGSNTASSFVGHMGQLADRTRTLRPRT